MEATHQVVEECLICARVNFIEHHINYFLNLILSDHSLEIPEYFVEQAVLLVDCLPDWSTLVVGEGLWVLHQVYDDVVFGFDPTVLLVKVLDAPLFE